MKLKVLRKKRLSHRNRSQYPELRLGGRLFKEQYNWNPGDLVEIEYRENEIIIKKSYPQPSS